jgi:L-ascorbate metabolism protein UlaG (beta-lactamase superfamily)
MDQVTIGFLNQSGFILKKGTSSLVIDPGKKEQGKISGDLVYATHHHSDHTAGIETFLNTNPEAKFICNEQVAKKFKKFQKKIILAVAGEEILEKDWKLKFIEGRHGLFSGVQNTGVIIKTSTVIFGHTGDTVDFQGFVNEKMDIFTIPISGLFASSPKKVLKELKAFQTPLPVIIPMHWLWRNPKRFCKKFNAIFPSSRCIVPIDGEKIEW